MKKSLIIKRQQLLARSEELRAKIDALSDEIAVEMKKEKLNKVETSWGTAFFARYYTFKTNLAVARRYKAVKEVLDTTRLRELVESGKDIPDYSITERLVVR